MSGLADNQHSLTAEEQALLALAEAVEDFAVECAAALQPLVASINELANTLADMRVEYVSRLVEK